MKGPLFTLHRPVLVGLILFNVVVWPFMGVVYIDETFGNDVIGPWVGRTLGEGVFWAADTFLDWTNRLLSWLER